jgi:short-subunit dehydrogenase
MSRLEFNDAVCVVTGAGSGIGRAVALELAGRGAALVLVSLPHENEQLTELRELCQERSENDVSVVAVDLTAADAPARVAAEAPRPIDVLVNNAGVLSYGLFCELDLEEQLRMVHVNIEAVVRLTHHVAGDMARRGRGWILNMSSVSAFQPAPHHAVYAATKAFLQSFSEALHAELAPSGVHVGTLNPPYTSTPMIGDIPPLPWQRLIPTMTPEDVARAAVRALEREQLYVVPDLRSRIANAWAPRFLPRALTLWLGSKLLRSDSSEND